MKGDTRYVTIIVQPDGALQARTIRLPLWGLRVALAALTAVTGLLVFVALSYAPLVRAAARVPSLERKVGRLELDNAKIRELAAALDSVERRYDQVRRMLGGDVVPALRGSSTLPIAPAVRAATVITRHFPDGASVPSFWPLDDPSYLTRGKSEADPDGPHEGLDIAVATGSIVRAAGGGVVVDAGQDPEYGLFVLVQHPEDYQTLYGHLSRIVSAKGDTVAPGQVLGLAGNTGRSSAPHLHFEVRLKGVAVDPLTLVKQES
jgi:murein DD-endopeptidase MepM/ murein hydrolase activator NlpD